jgi:hypothetical protein
MIAYKVAGDLVGEYMHMSGSTCLDSMYKFCQTAVEVFSDVYLREPNMGDTQRLLSINAEKGFPGILGKIFACIRGGRTTLSHGKLSTQDMLRVARSYLRPLPAKIYGIGFFFFDMPGSHNDFNVLQQSCYLLGLRKEMPH